MTIIDDDLLKVFRAATKCEVCGAKTVGGADPAHLYSRGAGRVDVRLNLASLCRTCHVSAHAGNSPKFPQLLALIAAREGVPESAITDEVNRLRNLSKFRAACPKGGKHEWSLSKCLNCGITPDRLGR